MLHNALHRNNAMQQQRSHNMQTELLAQIAKLPNTTVAPYRLGGGVQIIEQRANGVRTQSVWLDRPRTVQHLQDYLQSRTAN